jgi:hypothetical protein
MHKHHNLALVASANKLARMAWAYLLRDKFTDLPCWQILDPRTGHQMTLGKPSLGIASGDSHIFSPAATTNNLDFPASLLANRKMAQRSDPLFQPNTPTSLRD